MVRRFFFVGMCKKWITIVHRCIRSSSGRDQTSGEEYDHALWSVQDARSAGGHHQHPLALTSPDRFSRKTIRQRRIERLGTMTYFALKVTVE